MEILIKEWILLKKILEFDKKQKGSGRLKILTPKQMFQRLPIAFPQLKAGNKYILKLTK